jgi:thiazole/oxazole-forming peptide maturase SagC family component
MSEAIRELAAEIRALNLPMQPLIPKYFHIIPMEDERKIQFRTAGKTIVLHGKAVTNLIPLLIPMLNGNHTAPEIVLHLQAKGFDRQAVLTALSRLHDKGLLEDASHPPPSDFSKAELERYTHQLRFFSYFSANSYECQRALRDSLVAIFGLGQIGTQVLTSLVASGVQKIRGVDIETVQVNNIGTFYTPEDVGRPRVEIAAQRIEYINPGVEFQKVKQEIRHSDQIRPLVEYCDLCIICEDIPSLEIYEWANEVCLKEGVKWISGNLEGHIGRIGPAIIPRQTPCYKCYQLRFEGTLEAYDEFVALKHYLQAGNNRQVTYGSIPALAGIVGSCLALEALQMLTNFLPASSFGKVHIFDFSTLEMSAHEILKLPRCPSCSLTVDIPLAKDYE